MGNSGYYDTTAREERFFKENSFVGAKPEKTPLPTYEKEKDRLPLPVWEGHEDVLNCYDRVWQIAFGNLISPSEGTGFVSNYIDTAFNGCTFMWDSSFMPMFGKYGARSFNFQGTLDNFYAHQYPDGFICREIDETTGRDRFFRHDPSSTGPDIMAWSEWEYFRNFGGKERLARVFPCLMSYHEWMRLNRTWRNGTYWSSGWGCGMDNLPRLEKGYHEAFSHGHMIWCDACMQELMNCDILTDMARVLGRENDTSELQAERELLMKVVNDTLWDDRTSFYYDMWKNGELNYVKHIGAYWALLAGIVPEDRVDGFIAHLMNKNEFATPFMIPALSADHPLFSEDGAYWRGGVWAPTNFMTLRGLDRYGKYDLSHSIGLNYVKNVVSVFNRTGTVFENYAPFPDENGNPRKGNPARGDFVGWTGLVPISVLFEYVFGIKPDAENNTVRWHTELTEKHGVKRYPIGKDTTLDLVCEARESDRDEPIVHVKSNRNITVQVIWDGGKKSKTLTIA